MRSLILVILLIVGCDASAHKCKVLKDWGASASTDTSSLCLTPCIIWTRATPAGGDSGKLYVADCSSEPMCSGAAAGALQTSGDLVYQCTAGDTNTESLFTNAVVKCITHGVQRDLTWNAHTVPNNWRISMTCDSNAKDRCMLTYNTATQEYRQDCSTAAACAVADTDPSYKFCCSLRNCNPTEDVSKRNFCVKSTGVAKPLTTADGSVERCATTGEKCHTTLTMVTRKYSQGCTASGTVSTTAGTIISELKYVCAGTFCNDGRHPGLCFVKADTTGALVTATVEATDAGFPFCFVTRNTGDAQSTQGKGTSTISDSCFGDVHENTVVDTNLIRCCNYLGCNIHFSPRQQLKCPLSPNDRNVLKLIADGSIECEYTEKATELDVVDPVTDCTSSGTVGCCHAEHDKACLPKLTVCTVQIVAATSPKAKAPDSCTAGAAVACHVTLDQDGNHSQGCVLESEFEYVCGSKYKELHYHHGKTSECYFTNNNVAAISTPLTLSCMHTGVAAHPGTAVQVCTPAQIFCKNTVASAQYTQGCAASCTVATGVTCCQTSQCNAIKPTTCMSLGSAVGATPLACTKDFCQIEKTITGATYARKCISWSEFTDPLKCNGHAAVKVQYPDSLAPATKEYFCCATDDCNTAIP